MVSHGCIVLSSPPPPPPPPLPSTSAFAMPPPTFPSRLRLRFRLRFRLCRGLLLSHDPRLCGLLCRGHGQPTAVVALWCR
ncbi:hypothetical protein SLI_7311 [Streptomyces lividans 1326]|uniref:Uncharacterized protein n=1 Tax=Streptomyces lividans 1326 TaxID=1200984 RepID=A0A7U9HEX0_STRLI|nr:hypothetical protein SLI_7311 [Streptomyces lividans 1326]